MLEYWKIGFGIPDYRVNGPPKAEREIKWIISFINPVFHHSTIPLFHE
jgi:hypothetical protein